MASIGSRSAAFLAGYQPKNTPVTVHTAKERNTLHGWMKIGPVGNALHYPAGSASDDDTDDASGDADEDGFDEELAQDVDTAGAYTHAQADFARAFRHRYVHDVHNADAAHYERNAGYAGKQRGHQVGGGVQHGAEFLLAANGEVVVVTLLQLVVAAQYLGDFVGGIVRHVLGKGGGEDAAKVGLCQQAFSITVL